MNGYGENARFDFRFDGGGLTLCATRDRMPERTFELHLEREDPNAHFSCGFIEFVEVVETADSVLSRVMYKLRDTMPSFPADFPEALFRDTLSHWLLFNFGAPIRHDAAVPRSPTTTIRPP